MTFIAAFDAGLTGLVYDLRLPIAVGEPRAAGRRRGRRVSARLVRRGATASGPDDDRRGGSPWPSSSRSASTRSRRCSSARRSSRTPRSPSPMSRRRRSRRASRRAERPSARRVGRVRRPTADADADARSPRRRSPPASSPGPMTSTTDRARRRSSRRRPGSTRLRLEDFSVRNGPDLFVYLSPDPDGYADGALGARSAEGDGRLVQLRVAARHRPVGLREHPDLVQAVRAPVRRRTVRRRLTAGPPGPSLYSGLCNAQTSAYHPA